MVEKYYIGLDIGTDSVGWAATDEEYNLLKARGNDLWGSYLFDEAQSAESRRLCRTTRRRVARSHHRLMLLQSLFAEEMAKVDPLFFIRMNNSSLFVEDKDGRLSSVNALFDDDNFKDKDFFAEYPTIYHLRAKLVQESANDIRLLYLAVHHILKNRGHFLFESQSFDVNDKNVVKDSFNHINAYLSDNGYDTLELQNLNDVFELLRNEKIGKQQKSKQLKALFTITKNKQQEAIIKAMTGCTVNLKDLFAQDDVDAEIKSFSFDKPSFEADLPKIEDVVGGDNINLIHSLKAIYDWTVLCSIMHDEKYISLAKVNIYDKHKKDLILLKDYVRTHCPQDCDAKDWYKKFFRYADKVNNYAAYIGMDKQKGYKKCSAEEFYAFLKKELKIDDEYILNEIEQGTFLPKQVSKANGVIPYQVQLQELEAILANAEKQFPFLTVEQDGTTVSQKIKMLMTFRIPYYVGPLDTRSPFAWVARREGYETARITPWNFEQAIDKDASEENFIRRMTNKCTYLVGEDVLPASSLLYSEYVFLNELNNLKINGEKNNEARELIYEYAKTHKRITIKAVLNLLISNGLLPKGSKAEEVFSGLDGEFKSSLSTYNDLAFLGDRRETHKEMCEEIILWITLITDKNRLAKRIEQKYGHLLSQDEIKRIKGLNYSKWGRLSKELLDGIVCSNCTDENGEALTIIEAMRAMGENFMQLLSSKYKYRETIQAYNAESLGNDTVSYNSVKELYCSPIVKRSIWRSIELVREIVKIRGEVPAKIFVETAREVNDDSRDGKRTISRKQQLLDLYKSISGEERDWIEEIEKTPDLQFNRDRLVLYYRQMGRSMYSGKPISLDELFNKNICDIDHIYPQSKIKDDSLDNRVLVYRVENANKEDVYPLPAETQAKMRGFWLSLKERGLIGDIKYARLTRTTPLTQDELTDFINRQLVSTRQSTKAVIELLQRMLPETEIVYAKAGNANQFKQDNGIVKVRELNDLHHAKDAYLNIVVGNVYNTKFNHNAAIYFKNNGLESYNMKYLFTRDIPGAWTVSDKDRILRTVAKNTCRIVRMTERGKGALFNATIKTAGANDGLIPLKQNGAISNTDKYGGYDSATTCYFMLVRSKGKKDKTMLSLEAFPLYLEERCHGDIAEKLRYCTQTLGLIQPEILIPEIKLNTLFNIDGSYAYLRGRTGKRIVWCNANELYLDAKHVAILKTVCNYINKRKELNKQDLEVNINVTAENNLSLYDALLEKLASPIYSGLAIQGQLPLLRNEKGAFLELSLEEQCKTLMEVLHLMQCNSVLSNFVSLGGSAHAGINLSNKFIQDKDIKMILQSPTGHYRQVVDFSQYL